MDPVIDRALVLAGVAVCWSYELLPRWLLAIVVARELLMLAAGNAWVRRGFAIQINWPGRLAVFPTMFGIWLALLAVRGVAEGFLAVGLTLGWIATVAYFWDARRRLQTSSSA